MHDLVTAIAVVSALANVAAFAWIVRRARSRRKLEDAARTYMEWESWCRDEPIDPRLAPHRRSLMALLGWKPRETVAQKRPARPAGAGSPAPTCKPRDEAPQLWAIWWRPWWIHGKPVAKEQERANLFQPFRPHATVNPRAAASIMDAAKYMSPWRGGVGEEPVDAEANPGAPQNTAATSGARSETGMSLVTITAALIVFAFFALAAVAWGAPPKAWCPVPWDVEWCVERAGEDMRDFCAEVNPTTRKECKATMVLAGEEKMRRLRAQEERLGTAKALSLFRPSDTVATLRRGTGYTLGPNAIAKWRDIQGGCPDWLALQTTPRGCSRRVDQSVRIPLLDELVCRDWTTSAGGTVTADYVRARYGRPPMGQWTGDAQERWSVNCDALNDRFAAGQLGPASTWDGIASHREGFDRMATGDTSTAGGGGSNLACGGNPLCQTNRGENCETCPQDCGPCAPVDPPPPPAPRCGDNTCGGAESCATCAQDCGACPPTPPPVVNPPTVVIRCDEMRIVPGVNSTGKLINVLVVPVSPGVSRVVCEVRP